METKDFGNTPLKVSEIGLGLAALGRPGYINIGHGEDLNFNYQPEAMLESTLEVLDAAYGQGIRYFDVARSYGKGEDFLSHWIKKHKDIAEIVVGSKWGYTYTANWQVEAEKHEVKEHTLDVLNRQWPISRQLLGGRLRIYHIHSATPDSGVLDNEQVLSRLWELKQSGIVVGLSLSGKVQKDTLEKAFTIKRGEELLFQSVQISWNLLEQSSTEVIKKASQKGMGVIIKEALANGRLTDRNGDPAFSDKKDVLKAMAEKYKVGIDALSIAYILVQPWVSTVLSGATIKEQLLSNLKGLHVSLSREDIESLEGMAEPAEAYWKKRSELKWN